MSKKKEKKGVGGPLTDAVSSLLCQGIFPGRELTPAATNPSLFAGVLTPKNAPNEGNLSLYRHPFACDLDATDEQLASLGLIVPAEAPPKNHEYTIDSDEEDDKHGSSSSSRGSNAVGKIPRGMPPDRMHSAQNHRFRKGFKLGKYDDLCTTPLNTVAKSEETGVIQSTTASDGSLVTAAADPAKTSDKVKGKQRPPYPDDLHTSVPVKFITAEPRLSPMEYARAYYVAKKGFDEDGDECPLPRPEAYWAWTENHDNFLCIPKVPDNIKRAFFVTKLDDASQRGMPRYVHTEIPALRATKSPEGRKLRRAISNADIGLSRLRNIAAESKDKLFGRARAQMEETGGRTTPVLPHIGVGGSRLSIGKFAIIRG